MALGCCRKCGHYWSFEQVISASSIITKLCPLCIGALPTLNWSLTR